MTHLKETAVVIAILVTTLCAGCLDDDHAGTSDDTFDYNQLVVLRDVPEFLRAEPTIEGIPRLNAENDFIVSVVYEGDGPGRPALQLMELGPGQSSSEQVHDRVRWVRTFEDPSKVIYESASSCGPLTIEALMGWLQPFSVEDVNEQLTLIAVQLDQLCDEVSGVQDVGIAE
jgi:hypothetical protein